MRPAPTRGTPVDAPAVRFDFTAPDLAPTTDNQARAQAIAAQKAWRMSEIVGALAAGPISDALIRQIAPDPQPSAPPVETLSVLRGAASASAPL